MWPVKISNFQINQAIKLYENKSVKKTEQKNTAAQGASLGPDKADLSQEGRLLSLAQQKLKEVPDVRADLVNELKQSIANGTYKVNEDEIAEKILGRVLIDKLI